MLQPTLPRCLISKHDTDARNNLRLRTIPRKMTWIHASLMHERAKVHELVCARYLIVLRTRLRVRASISSN